MLPQATLGILVRREREGASMEDGFQGRAVLVFGASGALGSGVATAFAAAGATTGRNASVAGLRSSALRRLAMSRCTASGR